MFTFTVQNYNFKPKLCSLPVVILHYVAENKIPELEKALYFFAYLFVTLSFVLSLKTRRTFGLK
jgi:hypothetical protein